MKAPLSWIQDYVDLQGLSLEEIGQTLTMIGLEVEEITLVGLEKPEGVRLQNKYSGLSWSRDKFVVAEVLEVRQHPNADKLTLCELNDGRGDPIIALTGAPNLFGFLGKGRLEKPIKVAYAREGAQLYDGHQPGLVLTKLKKATIRGIESSSMIASEKELGISEEHEGVIFLDDDAPVGMPLADYMGDAVFEVAILPNMARDASVLGIARELSAALRRPLKLPIGIELQLGGEINQKISLDIQEPELNPRFMLGMVEGVQAMQSPYWVRRRLALAGMRPIDALVDATNYTMLETGQPLHAFDYDTLVRRAGGKPTIITRRAEEGETLTMLDGDQHKLTPETELVSDTKGPLSMAGVMGGEESGINDQTSIVLLEAASWNFINIRKTSSRYRVNSEASYRFSRDVHPALAQQALSLCLKRLQDWGGGRVVEGVIDQYSLRREDTKNTLNESDMERLLGLRVPIGEAKAILERLGFSCTLEGGELTAVTPANRTDIESGIVGTANLIEEVSRIYGYSHIPTTRLSGELPPQLGDKHVGFEESVRDLLVSIGLQDTLAYRLTSVQRESKILPGAPADNGLEYVRIANPISPERSVMRRSGLATMFELIERNTRNADGLSFFEIGPVFIPVEGQELPNEPHRLTIGLWGKKHETGWSGEKPAIYGFFDLKGILEALLQGLHIENITYDASREISTFHPGKSARLLAGETEIGVMGEVHPLVRQNYDFADNPVLAAELYLDQLMPLVDQGFKVEPLSTFPAMVEDIALIVDEEVPASRVEELIWRAGGKLLKGVALFDLFRGEKLGAGKKSLAYQLTYQAFDRTLSVADAAAIRKKIVKVLSYEAGAVLRDS
ncbi:MAG: phenylalanine--tRNA ligase subunit beta [Anaerolineaceae bacterium]|nr:phenylalanine--tRNA ligase subunit beta [Anaerolineaceae bacterium]MDD4577322.1 phenylalanine--tRNA ligase subunit beta [Anaerolineaceae bacterium]